MGGGGGGEGGSQHVLLFRGQGLFWVSNLIRSSESCGHQSYLILTLLGSGQNQLSCMLFLHQVTCKTCRL